SKSNGSIDLNSFASKDNNSKQDKPDKKDRKKTTKQRVVKILLSTFLVGVIVVTLIIGSFVLYAFTMVDGTMSQDLNDLKVNFTTTIYVKDGATGEFVEYQRLHGEYNRIWVEYDADAARNKTKGYTGIPQNLVNAFVAIEDKRFYSHYGVDWKRTTSAFANMFLHFYSSDQGGSTITQQLVKNLTADDEKKASRKLREIMRARYLENHYSKDTIMECYLNVIALGHGMSGVGVASNYYFNKDVKDLTLAECAAIASITKNPSRFSPDTNPEDNKTRRTNVLKQMLMQGYITQKEYDDAVKEELKIAANLANVKEKKVNSYAVDAIIRRVTKDIAAKNNYDMTRASNDFYSGGYKIYATIDPTIQTTVEKVFSNSDLYGLVGADGTKLQGSISVLDYKGDVIALAGGIGEKTENLGFNRATDAVRQPGSTMKPIAAYAPAIERKIINYSSIVNDSAVNYGKWKPNNWYGSYWGNITVQYALERSVNTIPVYLVNKMTPEYCYQFLTEKLGVTTLTAEDQNLSPLGMGGTNGGLSTLESAAAYAIFGNGGDYYKPSLYYKVCDQYDNVVLENKTKPSYAISSDTATVMNKLLQNVVYGSKGTGAGAKSYIPNMKIYAKTGTSNDQNDLWFVGGSPYYIASCWCGYDKQQPIKQSTIAMKMWGAVMSEVHKNLPAKEFEISPDAKCYYYCTHSGELATDKCPSKAIGWYRKSGLPKVCTTHDGSALPAVEEKKEEQKTP
ncbi:MAG: transglycosylase domain-containing protein, partial [Clostridia bacterium]|nr:transglycosylase domain-containing protein [Clostridia bacterium]